MSILYFPIQINPKISDFSYEFQEVILTSDMDFGTHTRVLASPVINKMTCKMTFTNAEFELFMDFFDAALGRVFYMKHPDNNYPRIDTLKYYAFSIVNSNINMQKIGDHSYSIDVQLLWHFRVPPVNI